MAELISPRGGSKTTYQANILKNICEMGSEISRYESINAKFIQLTGHTMNDLLEMFAAGYTLTPPKQQDLANIPASIME